MKSRFIAVCLGAAVCLTACNPLNGLQKEKIEESSYEITSVKAENMQEHMVYLKIGDF